MFADVSYSLFACATLVRYFRALENWEVGCGRAATPFAGFLRTQMCFLMVIGIINSAWSWEVELDYQELYWLV